MLACFSPQEVDIFEQRPFVGGKVASFRDKDGNHIEMGLHVFFGCYFNLFRLMAKCGVLDNLLLKVCVAMCRFLRVCMPFVFVFYVFVWRLYAFPLRFLCVSYAFPLRFLCAVVTEAYCGCTAVATCAPPISVCGVVAT